MRVLVACEFSGVVREAFRKRGHDAWSCDLTPALDDSPYHLEGDVFRAIDGGRWDLMIAHPPCTYLTNSGVRHLYVDGKKVNGRDEERWASMEIACDFFNRIGEAEVSRIARENPVMHGYAQALTGGKADQIIHPWQHGHGEIKKTGLRLKNLPKLNSTNIVAGRVPRVHHESPGIKNGLTRQQRRSITYQGIAEAMAAQWGSL